MIEVKKIFFVLNLMGSLFVWSIFIEPGLLTETHKAVSNWQGPDLKVVFFSDLHAGSPHINEKYIRNLVERINAQQADLILIGGDLVINGVIGGKIIPFSNVTAILKNLKAKLGIYFVLGNHDWWNDHQDIIRQLEEVGFHFLDNKAQLVSLESNYKFWLVGLGDDFTKHVDISKAFSEVSTNDPRILFMHDPAAIFSVKTRFFMAFAGHLHGGQVFIPGIGALVTPGRAPRQWSQEEWVHYDFGELYISKGIGTSILPIRFNSLPEFVVLNFKKSN